MNKMTNNSELFSKLKRFEPVEKELLDELFLSNNLTREEILLHQICSIANYNNIPCYVLFNHNRKITIID